jgi:hypothetical protein
VFAGAAREAVFSQPEVIRRINADFVPVALKAFLVNNPPDDEEGRLYREIGRSKIAPQGICVVNSAGKVLDWVLMFDDDKNIVAFLDHTVKRFAKFPDAKEPVPAERYMKFSSDRLDDVKDNGKALPVPENHAEGKDCPGKQPLRLGTVAARVYGRALDKDGKPVADTLRQEHYVEDRFNVTVGMQDALAKTLADAGAKRFRLADDWARLFASHAYLGQLDVNPVGAPGGKGDLKKAEIWAQKVDAGGKDIVQLRVEGETEAAGASGEGDGGDGRLWQHEVKLSWEGLIEMQEGRVTRLLLVAHGAERLTWGNKGKELKDQTDVARLPAGHPIDLACKVRYGITGEPIAAADAAADDPGKKRADEEAKPPDEARRQLIQAFGPTFVVFRDKAQKELKLTDEQKEKLNERFEETAKDAMQFIQKLGELNPEEREKELGAYRQKAQDNLAAFLKGALNKKQLSRFRQLELQQQGPFAVGQPDLARELKFTDEQKKKFMAVVEETQKQIQPLMKEAQSGGKPEEIGPKVMKIHKEQEGKIEAILTDAQKKQWKELLGKPFDFE